MYPLQRSACTVRPIGIPVIVGDAKVWQCHTMGIRAAACLISPSSSSSFISGSRLSETFHFSSGLFVLIEGYDRTVCSTHFVLSEEFDRTVCNYAAVGPDPGQACQQPALTIRMMAIVQKRSF